LVDYPRTK